MKLDHDLGDRAIREVIAQHPRIGEILAGRDIACVTCGVGICLLKDVVAIHGLSAEDEAAVEADINRYLAAAAAGPKEGA